MNIETRLNELRNILKDHDYAGYIVPTTDEYLSEYTPEYAKRLSYITGFTGSNGLAIILENTVLFFTDGRYINQCFVELDDHLFEIFDLALLPKFNWKDYIDEDAFVAYDPKLFTNRMLQNFSSINLKPHANNLIDITWKEQPQKPNSTIYDYPVKYAGEAYEEKINRCLNFLSENSAESLVITDSASICWLFNIRAHDVEFSPILLSYAIISEHQSYLFTNTKRIENEIERNNLKILDESEFSRVINNCQGTILFDESQASCYITNLIKQQDYKNIKNPCTLWKACKNEIEIEYMKKGHVQDAVAVCEMLAFIESEDISNLTEYEIGEKLTALRSKGENYVFDSFPTICGYQENGAIIHYRANKKSAKTISGNGLLLIDSGGQYMGATTDITRTISIGTPSADHKKYYTKVLKGHIALAKAIFPKSKVTGAHLDILARQYLWNEGYDYAHGTGHGVGNFLSVHEGPQNISLSGFATNLEDGMVVSNEPGYYAPGEFGIRIENMMYVKNADQPNFLCFEMLTLAPYSKALIDKDMLDNNELKYLEAYYSKIEKNIAPLLSERGQSWLRSQLVLL